MKLSKRLISLCSQTKVKRWLVKACCCFLNYGEGATVENPKWGLVGGQRNSPLSMSGDEIDGSDKASGGWGESLQGTKSWSIEQEGVYKVNNENAGCFEICLRE